MKKLKELSNLKNPLEGAEFSIGGKKVSERRFFKAIANDMCPPKKRVVKIETVKQLMRACPTLEIFGEEIKKYVITKGGRLMLWEDWYKKPHPLISKTEDAEFEIIVQKVLPDSKKNHNKK